MKRIILFTAVLLLAALACATPPPTPTGTPEPPTGTLTPTATENPVVTPTASQTPVPAEWHDVPIPNGDFDAELPVDKNQPGTYMNIFQGTVTPYNPLALAGGWLHRDWSPLYCNTPYAPERCQGVQDILDETGTVRHIGNNSMDYPEYKDSVGENRVVDGTNGQQIFRPFAPFRAGIWQEMAVPPDSTCEISALVQSWSATEWIEGALSNFPNPDAFNQSGWRIGIKDDPGPIYRLDDQGHVVYGWFQYGPWQIRHALDATDVQASPWYTGVPSRAYQIDHGMTPLPTHYDEFLPITATFETGDNSEVIVFVENMTLFGFRYTDRYIESVSMRCRENVPEPFPTPTQINPGNTPTPGPPPTLEATPIGGQDADPRQGTLVFTASTNIRECEVTNWDEDVLRYFLGIYPTQVCPVVDQFETGNSARNWQFVNDAGDNTFAWLATEPVEGDHSLATVAAVCYNGVPLARYYPDFVGGMDELPDTWVDPCGTGEATVHIAPQSLVSQGDNGMFDFAQLLEKILQLAPVVVFAAPLIAVLIDQAKRFGLSDGKAPLASAALNTAIYLVVIAVGEAHLEDIQNIVQAMTLLAPIVASLLLALLGSNAVHKWLVKTGIGFSYSERLAARP